MRILVVDDDQVTRLCLGKVLESAGQVVSVANGIDAVAAFDAALKGGDPFDLVCMDINMPRMDGQEALRRMRELEAAQGTGPGREAKVLMISACGDTANVSAAFFKGQADGYVQKPLRLAELTQALQLVGIPVE